MTAQLPYITVPAGENVSLTARRVFGPYVTVDTGAGYDRPVLGRVSTTGSGPSFPVRPVETITRIPAAAEIALGITAELLSGRGGSLSQHLRALRDALEEPLHPRVVDAARDLVTFATDGGLPTEEFDRHRGVVVGCVSLLGAFARRDPSTGGHLAAAVSPTRPSLDRRG